MTSLRRLPFALAALFVVVGLIAVCAYIISAWQVFGFAQHVWRLPIELCFGAAFVADLLSLAGLFATYLLRKASKLVQLYAWFVFLGMTGLSIAAAESYAGWRFAPEGAKPNVDFDARIASGAIVVSLALAVHLLIICRNHIPVADPTATAPGRLAPPAPPAGTRRPWWRRWTPTVSAGQSAPPAKTKQPSPPAKTAPTVVPVDPRTPPPTAASTAPPAAPAPTRNTTPTPAKPQAAAGRRGRQVNPDEQARRDAIAAQVIRNGGDATAKQAAADTAGVGVRSIENWITSYRARHPDRTARRDLATPMLGPDQWPVDPRDQPQPVGAATGAEVN